MAHKDQLAILNQGASAWNAWRKRYPSIRIDLEDADLAGRKLRKCNFRDANLRRAQIWSADLRDIDFRYADLADAKLSSSFLGNANFKGARLQRAALNGANLRRTCLDTVNLCGAELDSADLSETSLVDADLRGANLEGARLLRTKLSGAKLDGCRVHGISVWDVDLLGAKQNNLIITRSGQAEITVDNLELAQLIYLLLNSAKIRNVIDTIGKKGVLLLGRFTCGRLAILERLRDELRKRDFVPMVFNFDRPDTKDFTETVRLLAGLSRFVIADITNPRSAPLELQAIVPEYMIPFVPILEKGEEPFAMFKDLWLKHRAWVLDPIRYPSLDRLVELLDSEIVQPAEIRFTELLELRANRMTVRDI